MKLEFLINVNEYNEHVMRLYGFDSRQAQAFKDTIQFLVDNKESEIDLSTLDFIEPVNCTLILRVGEEDEGINIVEKRIFHCDLTVEAYKKMIQLIEPFCKKEAKTYQWLYDIDNPIDFLFSAGDIKVDPVFKL